MCVRVANESIVFAAFNSFIYNEFTVCSRRVRFPLAIKHGVIADSRLLAPHDRSEEGPPAIEASTTSLLIVISLVGALLFAL